MYAAVDLNDKTPFTAIKISHKSPFISEIVNHNRFLTDYFPACARISDTLP